LLCSQDGEGRGLSIRRPRATPHIFSDQANRIDVGCRRAAPVSLLLWSHPVRGPYNILSGSNAVTRLFREAKINELGHRGGAEGQHDIFWLEVTMDDGVPAVTVQVGKGADDTRNYVNKMFR